MGQTKSSRVFAFVLGLVLLASFLADCSTGRKSAGLPRAPDSEIGNEIRGRLQQDPELSNAGIRVSVFEGRVVLSGMVPNREIMERLIDFAKSVRGVKSVTNNLEVQRPAS